MVLFAGSSWMDPFHSIPFLACPIAVFVCVGEEKVCLLFYPSTLFNFNMVLKFLWDRGEREATFASINKHINILPERTRM